MRCNDIAAIMDEHRAARLTAAERGAIDAHLAACADCAAAWQADAELLALRLPATPATLLDRVAALATRPMTRPHRARTPFVVASALLAGAALAAVTATTILTIKRSPESVAREAAPTPTTKPEAVASTTRAPSVGVTSPPPEPGSTSVELVEFEPDTLPVVRRPPDYPMAALEQGLEGSVQIRFDITAAGLVENARVVDSTDPMFEASAVDAVSTWRYLPRIAAGQRVASRDIHTIIRFALAPTPKKPPDSTDQKVNDEAARQVAQEAARRYMEFSTALEIALDRVTTDDLRGAELQLDEMYAIYQNDGQRGALWQFYGYLYTVQGNYDRAIDAYEAGIAAYERAGSPAQGQWLPLANLYFARHQYDVALQTLLTYNEQRALARARSGLEPARPDEAVQRLIERLRALGVTEETLSPGR